APETHVGVRKQRARAFRSQYNGPPAARKRSRDMSSGSHAQGAYAAMNNQDTIRNAVRRALCLGAIASTASYAPMVAAQQPGTPPGQDLEEITVTGSRIATDPNLISSSPVSQVSAEELTYRG